MFLFLSFNLFAQSDLLLLLGGDEFNPLTYDAKTIALYDGDKELTTSGWGDQSTNNYDLTFFNEPTLSTVNGHGSVLFNGTDEYGRNTSVVATYPCTYYFVVKQITWTATDYFSTSTSTSRRAIYQTGTTPNIVMASGSTISSNPDLATDTYGVFTFVWNTSSSQIRTNLSSAVTNDAGANNSTGFYLGANATPTGYSNIEAAYIIIRTGADDAATQNKFINYLKSRFGI